MTAPEQITKSRIVVDTDVVSYIFKKDTRAEFFAPFLKLKSLAVSFMTVAELYYGAYKANWGTKSLTQLENHLKNYVVLPYDYLVCQEWARVRVQRESKGLSMSESDLWIAACALRHDSGLATNNGSHFRDIDNLVVISPTLI